MSTALAPVSITSEAQPEASRFDEVRLVVLNGGFLALSSPREQKKLLFGALRGIPAGKVSL